ncbi:MAG: four helix bundle protein [bacterium]
MKIKSFRDIIAWQKAKAVSLDIYLIFRAQKDFGFRDQIQRSSISIMNNIAEGFAFSDKKFAQYLDISMGSCYETQSMLEIAKELNYIEENKCASLLMQCEEIAKILTGLSKSLSRIS